MHELSLASAIVEKVLAHAESRPGTRVREVRLMVGEWMGVQTEQLAFCYRAIVEDTSLRDSILAIEPVAAAVRCAHCGYAGRPGYWDEAQWFAPVATLACPQCRKAVEVTEGNDCAIRAITYAP